MHVTLNIRDLKVFCKLIINDFLQKNYGGFKGVLYMGIRFFLRSTTNPTSVRKHVGRDLMLFLMRNTQSRACKKFSHDRWSIIRSIYYHSIRTSYVKNMRYTSIMRRFPLKNVTYPLLKLANLMPYIG